MGWWTDRVLPHVVERALGAGYHEKSRAAACAALSGDVVEIGFGSGRSLSHYPPAVTRVLAVEPSDRAWAMSQSRRSRATVPVERIGLDGQRLPLDDASVDSALSTWTLCTVPDAVAALRELHRVLRPGGQLAFVEHGAAPDEGVRRWQQRLTPLQRRVAGGCHLDRPVDLLLASAGFDVVRLDRSYAPHEPRLFGSRFEGLAVARSGPHETS